MRRSALALGAVFFVAFVSACAAPTPARRDVVLALVGEPASVFADDPGARVLAAAVTEPLVARDTRGELVPRLAADVPTLENGGLRIVTDDPKAPDGRLVATFRLRDGLVWQDGQPITAQDVRFAHDADATAAPGTTTRWLADRIESVDVVDEHFVRIVYRANERWDGYALAPRVLPRHILAGADAATRTAYEREPVHAGAFSVAAWIPGYGVTLAAFKDHVGGRPALGRIEVRFYPDRTAVLNALRRGEVDVAPSPDLEADLGRTLDRFGDANGFDVYYNPVEALDVLRFAPRGRFADRAVRKAIELTIDRQGIIDDIFAGRARVPRSYLVPPLWAAVENTPIARPDRDAARALLAQAGFRHGAYGILERGSDRMVGTLVVPAGSPGRLDAAHRVAGDLAAIGIAVDVSTRPATVVDTQLASGEFDLAIAPVPADDAMLATDLWVGRVEPWFDVLATAARHASGRAEQGALYAELQRIWSDDLPALPLYQRLRVDVAARTLSGIQPTPDDGALTWNAVDWRFAGP